ncbi:uncharacterized protein F5891DRAFT_1195004 [Suillus fuscotomentosus]|uniref:Glycoside hydrolase family 31 N-terminal domain-containing protein n=1 Tax=Suillus fuscotomentosus TaxID=1912939 RepID=A0AAD4DVB3_9AGAM|nr:uncharacterized protein F5891DRAFT_1195004 [Suillus fuscotomentosus]KAG1894696.1 hypothetical protein F5891DRAFT_1195004 [Suillus fuscotomentosus]
MDRHKTQRPRISIPRHNLPQPRPRLLRNPKHATDLSLPSTIGPTSRYTGPFRLYNADIFGYPLDSPTSLYGSISLMHAHFATPTVAIFNAIASETWIELE